MALPRLTFPLAALAALLSACALAAAAPDRAAGASNPTAIATGGCQGVTISPATRKVRRGGRVLLRGRTCSAGAAESASRTVQLKIRRGNRWRTFAKVEAEASGDYRACVRIRGEKGNVRVRAVGGGDSATTKLKVSKKGAKHCGVCPLEQPESMIPMQLPEACGLVASDTGATPDPTPFYGSTDCETSTRHQVIGAGGDTHAPAVGSGGDTAYRSTTVFDGDDFWGERCELGKNDWRTGPTVFYHEGMRRVTYVSFRLPDNLPLDSDMWQGAMQMKQTQPSDNGGGTPVLSLGASHGTWQLWNSGPGYTTDDAILWEVPAQQGVWTRFAWDVVYSQNPNVGSVKLYIDLNGDNDFGDTNEQSPRFHVNTLKYEIGTDDSDGMVAGQSIPSHLRVGIYHNPDIACPNGCAVEADNVQVVKP